MSKSHITTYAEPLARSPLEGCLDEYNDLLLDRTGVTLSQRGLPGLINLRGQPDEDGLIQAVAAILGGELPLMPNTTAQYGAITLCWLRPDEWLVMTPTVETVEATLVALRQIGGSIAVTEVSSAYAVMGLSGSQARQVLAKGCTLDLHPRQFTTGHCAQSLLAKADVLLIARDEDDMEIVVRRSFADYLWRWLVDAAEEYGVAVF